MNSLQPGDLVVLKSQGPTMTVSSLSEGNQWYCQWFNDGYLHGNYFPETSLNKATT